MSEKLFNSYFDFLFRRKDELKAEGSYFFWMETLFTAIGEGSDFKWKRRGDSPLTDYRIRLYE